MSKKVLCKFTDPRTLPLFCVVLDPKFFFSSHDIIFSQYKKFHDTLIYVTFKSLGETNFLRYTNHMLEKIKISRSSDIKMFKIDTYIPCIDSYQKLPNEDGILYLSEIHIELFSEFVFRCIGGQQIDNYRDIGNEFFHVVEKSERFDMKMNNRLIATNNFIFFESGTI